MTRTTTRYSGKTTLVIPLMAMIFWTTVCLGETGANWVETFHVNPSAGALGVVVHDDALWRLSGGTAGQVPVWKSLDGIEWTLVGKNGPSTHMYDQEQGYLSFQGKLWFLEEGKVCCSPDGVNWLKVCDPAPWGNRIYNRCAVYGGKMWSLGGYINNGPNYKDVWSSSDGITWVQTTSAAPWGGVGACVAFDNKLWVFEHKGVTPNGVVWSSVDGTDWQLVSENVGWQNPIAATAYAGKMWLLGLPLNVYPDRIEVWCSEDGVQWTQTTPMLPTGNSGLSFVTFQDRLCVVDWQNVWFSTDGAMWDHRPYSVSPWQGRCWFGAEVFNDEMWIMGGITDPSHIVIECALTAWSSAEGSTWVERANTRTIAFGENALVYDGKLWSFPMVGNASYSTDGQVWTEFDSPLNSIFVLGRSAAVFDESMWLIGGIYVDFGGEGPSDVCLQRCYVSTDGSTWEQRPVPWCGRYGCVSLVFNGKLWLLGGGFDGSTLYRPVVGSDIWYTSDGSTWQQATEGAPWPARTYAAGVVADGKMWILGGEGADGGPLNDVWSSPDGVNWTEVSSSAQWPPRYGHKALVYNNRLWVMGGTAGELSGSGPQIATYNDVWYSSLDGGEGEGEGETGTLRVTIEPPEAIVAGALWSLDASETLHASGNTAAVYAGAHVVKFTDVPGFTKPADIPVTIIANQQSDVTGTYVPLPIEEFTWGDLGSPPGATPVVLCDGKAGGQDASLVLKWYAGLIDQLESCPGGEVYTAPAFPPGGDVNADGKFGGQDASVILQYYAGLITCFPADVNCDQLGPEK